MNAYHLRRTEIEYELKVRGIATEGNADDLRKKLSHCFSNNIGVEGKCVAELDSAEELEVCDERLADLTKLVEEYEGNTRDNEYKRIQARLWHWYLRAQRIPVAAASDTEEEERKVKLLDKLKVLVDAFQNLKTKTEVEDGKNTVETEDGNVETENQKEDVRINGEESAKVPFRPPSTSQSNVAPQTGDVLSSADRHNANEKQKEPNSSLQPTKSSFQGKFVESQSKIKAVPVFKWGLKFEGDGSSSVAAFLERAEELSKARGVPFSELYDSAVDLFSGSALMWYRSAYRRINSWDELKMELKLVFQSADYDDRLQLEILHRTQGETESLDLFLAAMDGLFSRLSTPVSEEIKLQRILKNLNPFIQDKLCMFNITSLDELRCLGRRAEVGRLRSSTLHPPPQPNRVLEPDLAFSTSRRRPIQGNLAFMKTSSSGNGSTTQRPRPSRPLKCWNCGEENHGYRDCTKELKIFCFGCGETGVKKASCSKCQSKNVQRRGPL